MVWACLDVILQPFPHLGDRFHGILLEVGNFPPQGIGFAHGEEFCKEHHRTFVPRVDNFLFLIKPLLHLSREGDGKQTEPDA